MKLKRPAQRPPRETIVTMIDVVFFLLVFFMLIGRYDASAPFELSPPISPAGDALPAGGVMVSVSAEGRLAVDGVEMDRAALLGHLRGMGETPGAEERLLVKVNAFSATPLRRLMPLLGALEGLPNSDVVLVVTPKEQ